MTAFLPAIFEQLKQRVLSELGLKQITAADCAYVSAAIYKKTRKRVSETTLKRVYGFAYYEFNPSAFTMNLMAEFCGYAGWKDFCKYHQKSIAPATNQTQDYWQTIIDKTERITSYTLKTLKNRSGIPYDLTIERKAINEHFALFADSNCTATVLAAPTGYGKTISLCQWVDRYLMSGIESRQDIVLFFSGNALMSAYNNGRELNDWLMALLGIYDDNNIIDLFSSNSTFKGRFYLVVDGLDEYNYKDSQFAILFRQLVDVISLHQEHPWFKVIITMRSSSWINHSHLINNEKQWFTGFMPDNHTATNMPLFSNEEIVELCGKLGTVREGALPFNVLESFSYPLYFQYYFQKRANSFSINNFNQVSVYETISAYILNKIYRSKHSADCIMFLRGLINEMHFKEGYLQVDKLKLYELIKVYPDAYKDLLHIGYLQEINVSQQAKYSHFVRFSNRNFLEFSLGRKLMHDNEDQFNSRLIEHIDRVIGNTDLKLPIVKWCLYHTIANDWSYDLSLLDEPYIKVSEKSELIVFVSELLNRRYLLDNSTEDGIPDAIQLNEDILNYFIGLEFTNSSYEKALLTMLNFKLSATEKIVLQCCLSIIYISQLNIEKLEEQLEKLKQLSPDHFTAFPVNPLVCLDSIYYYLKYGIVKREAMAELTHFYFNPPVLTGKQNTKFNEVIFLLGTLTLFICQNPRKILRYLKATDKVHPQGSIGYHFLNQYVKADAQLALGNSYEALNIFSDLSAMYPHEETGYTAVMRVCYYALKLKLTIHSNQENYLFDEIRNLVTLCDDSSFKFIKIYSLAFVLSNYSLLKQDSQIFNQFYFDFIKTARTSGCVTESFITQQKMSSTGV